MCLRGPFCLPFSNTNINNAFMRSLWLETQILHVCGQLCDHPIHTQQSDSRVCAEAAFRDQGSWIRIDDWWGTRCFFIKSLLDSILFSRSLTGSKLSDINDQMFVMSNTNLTKTTRLSWGNTWSNTRYKSRSVCSVWQAERQVPRSARS